MGASLCCLADGEATTASQAVALTAVSIGLGPLGRGRSNMGVVVLGPRAA